LEQQQQQQQVIPPKDVTVDDSITSLPKKALVNAMHGARC